MFQLGSKHMVKAWVKTHGGVVQLGVRAPTHKRLIEANIHNSEFEKALAEYREAWLGFFEASQPYQIEEEVEEVVDGETRKVKRVRHEVPPDKTQEIAELLAQVRFRHPETLQVVYDFINEHVVGIRGVALPEGDEVHSWDELTLEQRLELLEHMSLVELSETYRAIQNTSALDPNV